MSEYKKYVMKDDGMVVNKAPNGCNESAKLWYQHLDGTLEKLEFVADPEECCCFKRDVGDKQCTIIVYVNDLLVTCKDEVTIVRN